MRSKLQILCLVIFCGLFEQVGAQTKHLDNISPKFLINGSYFSGTYSGQQQQNYVVLRAFIVNYSDDTLKFWGSGCHPGEFFAITTNNYVHLADDGCSNFEQTVVPPKRSLLIPLKLSIDKQPEEIVRLKVSMKFYRWFNSSHFLTDREYHRPEILTDTITLNNIVGTQYYTKLDWKEHERKEKLILPTTKLYLLTAEERRLYTVTAGAIKIIKAADSEYFDAKKKVFSIPVTVHNHSNEPLKYYSMSCSWQEFYNTNNKNIDVLGTACQSNSPIKVIVPAHSVHTDIVRFVYKKDLNNAESFRVGLNINKNVQDNVFGGYDEELTRYNIVWSNAVQFINK